MKGQGPIVAGTANGQFDWAGWAVKPQDIVTAIRFQVRPRQCLAIGGKGHIPQEFGKIPQFWANTIESVVSPIRVINQCLAVIFCDGLWGCIAVLAGQLAAGYVGVKDYACEINNLGLHRGT